MAEVALLFPGQGAQHVGMGQELCAAFPKARAVFEEASDRLRVDLLRLCAEGPEAELRRTSNTQPAVLVHSVACLRVFEEMGMTPRLAAGHSLGEYSAHVAAGSLSVADAAHLVRRRGEEMEAAGRQRPGTMAAILGLPPEALETLVDRASEAGILAVANLNSPRQVVLSGEIEAVRRAVALAPELGAKRAIPLEVSGAFHSPLMEAAAAGLAEALDATEVLDPTVPVVANATAEEVTTEAQVRQTLKDQLTAQVRWEASMRRIAALGLEAAIELGPGSVLRGLARDIDRAFRVHSVAAPQDFDRLGAALEAAR